ncbi:MAG: VapE domain-containing protein [Sulfuricellaceae bacterium]
MTIIKMRESAGANGYQVAEINPDVIIQSGLVTPGHRWCLWRAGWVKGRTDKPAKVPCNASGKALSVAKPETWLTFEDARAGWDSGRFDGIGLLMSSAHDLVGADLDKCLEPDGSISPGHDDIVAEFVALDGYIEISPSGRGLRQFLRGKALYEYSENNGTGLEVYDDQSTRYLTVSGQVWPVGAAVGALIENQAALEDFIRRWGKLKAVASPATEKVENEEAGARTTGEVLALLDRFNLDGKVTRLLAGDTSDYPGPSEADEALCCQVAYFSRDPLVIDAIVRGSGLMRKKWDSKRGKESYGALTIRKALKWQQRNYDTDQAEKLEQRNAAAANLKAADQFLSGGGADLRTRNGWKKDIWALSEMLLRDTRLLGICYYDEFSNFPTLTNSLRQAFDDRTAPDTVGRLSDCHYRAVQSWFGKRYGIALKKDVAAEVVARWSQGVRRNPATEQLRELVWDGKARLDDWLITYCKAETTDDGGRDISEYVKAVGSRWVLSVVARAMIPGCKADCMLILEGKQGTRKSSAVRALAEIIGPEYFREGFHLGEGAGKDAKISLRGRLVVEWGELSGMGRKDRNELKTFLTQQTDSYRGVYGIAETDWPRTAVFCGTTNEAHYLSDPSGNRRFWPVKIGRIELEKLRANGGQIWAEAVVRYDKGERWWFDDADPRDTKLLRMAEAEQRGRLSSGMWEELGADLADKLVKGELPLIEGGLVASYLDGFKGEQVRKWLTSMIGDKGMGAGAIDDATWLRVAEGLRRAGWESFRSNGMKWRLTVERREELCQLWDVFMFPGKSLKVYKAELEAQRAMDKAKGKAKACA